MDYGIDSSALRDLVTPSLVVFKLAGKTELFHKMFNVQHCWQMDSEGDLITLWF